jgi:predicted transposase YdaD
MYVNREYKNSVFIALFSNPEALRELYSALEGVDLPPDIPIDINTLSDVLIKGKINDVSFTVDNRLVVLVEHQSTLNYNMPLRLLIYIAFLYQKIVDRQKVLQRKLEKIPAPEFIVLYNGKEPYPDHQELRLSDSFKAVEGLKLPNTRVRNLELVVQVYNINRGHSHDLLERCKTLGGYSCFIGKVREFERVLPLAEAYKAAIKYCIEYDVLKQFLETHGSEVVNMLLQEITLEDEMAALRAEAIEEGLEQGRELGRELGLEQGRELGLEQGRELGREQGLEQGKLEIARNLLAEGSPPEFVQRITGLSQAAIESCKL